MQKLRAKNLKRKDVCDLNNGAQKVYNSLEDYSEHFTWFYEINPAYGYSIIP